MLATFVHPDLGAFMWGPSDRAAEFSIQLATVPEKVLCSVLQNAPENAIYIEYLGYTVRYVSYPLFFSLHDLIHSVDLGQHRLERFQRLPCGSCLVLQRADRNRDHQHWFHGTRDTLPLNTDIHPLLKNSERQEDPSSSILWEASWLRRPVIALTLSFLFFFFPTPR